MLNKMKKIFFATIVAISFGLVSCTSDAVETKSGSNQVNNSSNNTIVNLKTEDSIGGQGGLTPPPPPVKP